MKAVHLVAFLWIALGIVAFFLEDSPVGPEPDTQPSDRSKQL
jgi:hypothetical protein